MKILVAGNLGYIGPVFLRHLRRLRQGACVVGLDTGYFAHNLTEEPGLPEVVINTQIFGDIRDLDPAWMHGVDAVVNLAAISNDPMGNSHEQVTLEVNHRAAIDLAREARTAGARAYVYASSCSIYGFAEGDARREEDALNPLTAYARSKVQAERDLAALAGPDFTVTCLRFATACGMSPRLRLDLVLNDFVASALSTGMISILSDGTPWRPLIHVQDMSRALDWALDRPHSAGGPFLAVNVGSDAWNVQVRDLAAAVAEAIPGTQVAVNSAAPPDRRSYRVDFSRFRALAPDHQPRVGLREAVDGLRSGLESIRFHDANFRTHDFMRLRTLTRLRESGRLDDNLRWRHV
jgi:nucleoside-diphosphate-sugar epimerase